MRIVAAAGLVAVLALGGGFMLLGRGPSEPAAAPVIKPLHPVKKHLAAAKKAPLAARKVKAKAKVAAKPKAKPTPKAEAEGPCRL